MSPAFIEIESEEGKIHLERITERTSAHIQKMESQCRNTNEVCQHDVNALAKKSLEIQ